MRKKTIAITLAFIAAATATLGVASAILLANPGRGNVPMSRPTVSPIPASSLPEKPGAMADVAGMPVHITVQHGDQISIDTAVVPITLDSEGMLAPPPGVAGVYFSQADWNTIPGDLDRYRGIITGHDVTGGGAKDVFYNLGSVKKGDQIALTYQLDTGGTRTATFKVTADAASVPKADVIRAADYQYLWQPSDEPGRYLSLLSCDLAQAEFGQHSRNNWVVDSVRVE